MKKESQPQFLREFTKEQSAKERKEAADEIRAKRKEHFEGKKSKEERLQNFQENILKGEQSILAEEARVEDLEKEIDELSSSGLGKILNYFNLRKLRAEVAFGKKTYEQLKQDQENNTAYQQVLDEELSGSEANAGLEWAKGLLNNFYKEQKKKWENSEYSKEDVTKYFSEEHLASLSVKDYALLLKRFSGKIVAHVTRQGVRDHTGMIYHTGGSGEYADGFMKIAQDGRLRSPLGIQLIEKEKEKALQKYLRLDTFKTKEDALEYVNIIYDSQSQGDPGSYTDKMAVHFATEEVADHLYGSERANEIFIAYPSEYIASQYYFSGQLTRSEGGQWNDQWVWANEERGMDLDAGLVFIPADAKVDKKTGSRYELDENKMPIINQKYKNLVRKFADSPNFDEISNKVLEEFGNRDWEKRLKSFRKILEKDFGIEDERLQTAVLDYSGLREIKNEKEFLSENGREDPLHTINATIQEMMREQGILYVEVKDTISSKDFWENYFKENPGNRPSKVVYYEGGDPTAALNNWKPAEKNIKDKSLGFSERKVLKDSPQATSGMDRFASLAKKVINDYFENK